MIDDKTRIENILAELFAKATKAPPSKDKKPYRIDENAKNLLMEYVDEMACALIEESCLLAKHRTSNVVEVSDIQLLLLKKFGIEVPGISRSQNLHSSTVGSSSVDISSAQRLLNPVDEGLISYSSSETEKPKKYKKKRKHSIEETGDV